MAADEKIVKSEEEWRTELSEEQFRVLRQAGTERPFSGKYYNHKGRGIYRCAGCGKELFSSEDKFDSGSGWPSFFDVLSEKSINKQIDTKLARSRTEVLCARCGGHLGHVFSDGPKPTGKRYCINSVALEFDREESDKN